MVSGRSRVFTVLGDPVGHSLSPVMHNAAFRALGLDAVYVALRCDTADVAPLVGALARSGGGGNITVPHKAAGAAAVERCGPGAELLGVCNTFWGDGGVVVGENTDVAGVTAALARLRAPATRWLVVGTGGSARAVAAAARTAGAAVAVRSRSSERALEFARWAERLGVRAAEPAACEVLINATPLGLRTGDALPVAVSELPGPARVALDLVYARGETPWVRAMRKAGLRAADGRGMLVAQGAAAFECWFPAVRAPVDVMRGAVDAALR